MNGDIQTKTVLKHGEVTGYACVAVPLRHELGHQFGGTCKVGFRPIDARWKAESLDSHA